MALVWNNASWLILTAVAGGLAAVAITRPWRFFRSRNYCPQCQKMLPRWNCWGWRETWVCSRCGCHVGR